MGMLTLERGRERGSIRRVRKATQMGPDAGECINMVTGAPGSSLLSTVFHMSGESKVIC